MFCQSPKKAWFVTNHRENFCHIEECLVSGKAHFCQGAAWKWKPKPLHSNQLLNWGSTILLTQSAMRIFPVSNLFCRLHNEASRKNDGWWRVDGSIMCCWISRSSLHCWRLFSLFTTEALVWFNLVEPLLLPSLSLSPSFGVVPPLSFPLALSLFLSLYFPNHSKKCFDGRLINFGRLNYLCTNNALLHDCQ